MLFCKGPIVVFRSVCGAGIALLLAACQPGTQPNATGPLAAVSPIPKPVQPPWIVAYSPKGEAGTLAQIRVIFKEPVIPLERLESPDEAAKLQYFKLDPALPGHFRFLTPRMVGFQADRAIPIATRVRVTVGAGLTDLKNNRLDNDFAWTFITTPVTLTHLPSVESGADTTPLELQPALRIYSNAELDAASLASKASFSAKSGAAVGATATYDSKASPSPDDQASQTFDPSQRTYVYTLKPASALEKGTSYTLRIDPGVQPAQGNLPSDQEFKGAFSTYGEFKLTGAGKVNGTGRYAKGDPQINFSNGLDAASANNAITISPSPVPGTKLVTISDGDTSVPINPWALVPNTTYTVQVAGTLKDQFGQTLGTTQTATFSTSDYTPDFWAPTGLNIFARTNSLRLNYSAVNLPGGRYRAVYKALSPADVTSLDYDGIDESSKIFDSSAAWPARSAAMPKNAIVTIGVPVLQQLGAPDGMLAYGATSPAHDNAAYYGLVGITNLGVFAQWFPQSGWVAVQHLSDGSPAGNAVVDVYRAQTRTPCASGSTNAAGTFTISGIDVERCSVNTQPGNAPSLFVIAREGRDWAYTRLNDSSGYGYDVYLGWSNGKPDSRGTIFSDRQMYQPGEHAMFTGAAYYLQNGVLKRDAGGTYAVSLRDANGNVTSLGSKRADTFGMFSVAWTVRKDQPLGYYSIKATGANGNQLNGDLRVAEFKPPNFSVTLSLDKKYAVPGDTVVASGKSAYLFGSPLQSGKAHYDVTRAQAYLQPKGWDGYQFGRQWFWPDQAPTVDTDVLQNDTTLDAQGQGTQNVTLPADLPFPMTYTVDMSVSDVSNLSVSDSKSFTALPADAIIGLQSDFVGDENKAFPVKLVVTSPDGKPADGRRVHVELQSMDYSAATQLIEGGEAARNAVKYTTVDQADVTSGTAPQSVSLKAGKAGAYRIRANFADAKTDASETDTQIWISGPDEVRWNAENPSVLKISLDKSSYKPGDVATALVQSPYPQADLYFSVVREKTLYTSFVKVTGGAPRVRFRVTPAMLPNAAVEAILVRRGKPLEKLAAGTLDSLVRIGMTPFSTAIDAKYLKLAITPANAKVSPGGRQTVTLALRTAGGQPASGEFAVMVVNDAILQLTGYRLPDLVKTVYADQPISTRLSDNRHNVVLSPLASPIAKGFGYGGGFMEGAGSTRVRRNFQQLAYYNGALKTGANGTASISFTMPDDLTTWRVMAVGVGGSAQDFRFAVSDATFISTKPLLANPLLPQFGRTGDIIDGGLSVTNTTGTNGNLTLDGTLTGALRFADAKSTITQSQQSQLGTQGFRFPMTVGQAAPTTMQFKAAIGTQSDAFNIPFEIRNQSISESVAQSGATNDAATIPFSASGSNGTLDLWLSSSIVPQIVTPAERVLREESIPFIETSASRLAIATALKTVTSATGQKSSLNLAAEAAADLAALRKLQRDDGGLEPWPSAKADPLLSAYAAESVGAASTIFPVNAALKSGLQTYLASVLADPSKVPWCNSTECRMYLRLNALIGLSALGSTRTDFLPDIYAQRDKLDFSDRARLALYLLKAPGWHAQGTALAQKLQESVYLTARNATANLPEQWTWFGSANAGQAEMLRLMIAQRAPAETIDSMVRTLTIEHCTCPFINTYATARKLTALVDYLRTQPAKPNFTATALLGGTTIGSASFNSPSAPTKQLHAGGAQLAKSSGPLQLSKRGTGTLHYVVSYAYVLTGEQPGALSGLRITRTVRPAGGKEILAQMGLQKPSSGVSLTPSQVFDIGLEIISDHPVDHVMITDPLPAGLEAVDATFQISNPYFQARDSSWQIDYQTIYKDRVFAYADHLDAGVYSFHYLVRSVTPGTYAWPGGEAHLQYAPEEFGRTASTTLTIPQ